MTNKVKEYYAKISLTGEVEITINASSIEEARGIAAAIVDSEIHLSPNLFRRSQVHPDVFGYVSGKVRRVAELESIQGEQRLPGRKAYTTPKTKEN